MDSPMARRGKQMLDALRVYEACTVSRHYEGNHKILMTYGAGLAQRMDAIHKHRDGGGIDICWDLGYWDRKEDAMRLSIGSLHPTSDQLEASTGSRRRFKLREDADPDGPILLIGIGDKSASLYGLGIMGWETDALRMIQRTYPGKKVLWRPKGKRPVELPGAKLTFGMPIEQAMKGCSLVVCRYSNVAVDACVAGIPVVCDGGAAKHLYNGNLNPSRDQRIRFLDQLSWWNWHPNEARDAWTFIKRMIA